MAGGHFPADGRGGRNPSGPRMWPLGYAASLPTGGPSHPHPRKRQLFQRGVSEGVSEGVSDPWVALRSDCLTRHFF